MSLASRGQLVLSVVIAGALSVQALASCAVWVLLSAPATCCPSHEPGTAPVVAATCCAAVDQDGQAPSLSTGNTKAPSRAIVSFWAIPLHVDLRPGYHVTLPVAARGHTSVSLSALLI